MFTNGIGSSEYQSEKMRPVKCSVILRENGSPDLDQKIRSSFNKKEVDILWIWKQKNLTNTYTLLESLKKWHNMMVTVIPIVVKALGTISKNLEKRVDQLEIRERIETIQTTAVLKSKHTEDFWRADTWSRAKIHQWKAEKKWVIKMIHWELYKRLKIDHADK